MRQKTIFFSIIPIDVLSIKLGLLWFFFSISAIIIPGRFPCMLIHLSVISLIFAAPHRENPFCHNDAPEGIIVLMLQDVIDSAVDQAYSYGNVNKYNENGDFVQQKIPSTYPKQVKDGTLSCSQVNQAQEVSLVHDTSLNKHIDLRIKGHQNDGLASSQAMTQRTRVLRSVIEGVETLFDSIPSKKRREEE